MPTTKADIAQLIAWGTVMFSLLGIFIILFLFYYRKRHMSFHKNEQAFQQTLLRSQLEIQEQTMKNISQEIHDNVGQMLSLAKLQLSTAGNSDPSGKDEKINSSKDLVAKAIKDLRSLSHTLNADYINEVGLATAIEQALAAIQKSGEFETRFALEGNPRKLEDQKELIVFRIVQEMLNNIMKHSKARLIDIGMNYQPGLLLLTISDNGQGFDLSPLNDENNKTFGLGIKNMNSRARLIGARLSIASTLGLGTTATISITHDTAKQEYYE